MTVADDLSHVRCAGCGITGELILKHNRQGCLTHAWLPEGWRQTNTQTLCPDCPGEDALMTAPSNNTELELIADQITQTIFNTAFDQASRRQQELALTCAQKIREVLAMQWSMPAESEVQA